MNVRQQVVEGGADIPTQPRFVLSHPLERRKVHNQKSDLPGITRPLHWELGSLLVNAKLGAYMVQK
jgi:hypothetical protein